MMQREKEREKDIERERDREKERKRKRECTNCCRKETALVDGLKGGVGEEEKNQMNGEGECFQNS